mmetsp:Transcript_18415/g.50686  ORF Transcript_18415/g.50686 Transcript_18415/m.50686 type:complete len:148 (+) Transcript_18415:901-1344(+)
MGVIPAACFAARAGGATGRESASQVTNSLGWSQKALRTILPSHSAGVVSSVGVCATVTEGVESHLKVASGEGVVARQGPEAGEGRTGVLGGEGGAHSPSPGLQEDCASVFLDGASAAGGPPSLMLNPVGECGVAGIVGEGGMRGPMP